MSTRSWKRSGPSTESRSRSPWKSSSGSACSRSTTRITKRPRRRLEQHAGRAGAALGTEWLLGSPLDDADGPQPGHLARDPRLVDDLDDLVDVLVGGRLLLGEPFVAAGASDDP